MGFFFTLNVYLYCTMPDGTGSFVSSKLYQCISFFSYLLLNGGWTVLRLKGLMLKCYWWLGVGHTRPLALLTHHLLLHWPPTLLGRCNHLGQRAGARTAKGSCSVVILHFPESWWVLSGDGGIACCGRDHLVEESGHSQGHSTAQNDCKPHCFSSCTDDKCLPSTSLDLQRFMVFSSQRSGFDLTSVHQFFIFLLWKVLT